MRLGLLACVFAAAAVASVEAKTTWEQLDNYNFEQWMKEFNVVYSSSHEYEARKGIFNNRLESIRAHNANPHSSYKQGVNQLTDRYEHEYQAMLGYKPSHPDNNETIKRARALYKKSYKASAKSSKDSHSHHKNQAKQQSIDWRDHGVVGQVKDQGQCGSCWTFGTTATMESHYARKTGQLPVLSEQQILDCTPNSDDCGGTGGCGGGTPELAMAKLIELGGQVSEWTYPYQSYYGTNATCSFNARTPVVAKITGYTVLPANDATSVEHALLHEGPLAINVDASAWSTYESGVFNACNMTQPDINHVVQLVGFGFDQKLKQHYWTIKNSWGTTFGELGYMRIMKSSDPTAERCGVDVTPSDGTGCNGGPKQVTVCGECGIVYDTSYPTF